MSLSAINNATYLASQLQGITSTTSTSQSSGVVPPGFAPADGPGRFAAAVSDAFASLGIAFDGTGDASTSTTTGASAGTTSTDASASSDDASSAVSTFLQSLFAALHGQSNAAPSSTGDGTTQPPPTVAPTSTDATADATTVRHGHHHGHGKIEADLQSLVAQLDASSDTTTSSTTTDGAATPTTATTTATTTSTTALDTLEKNFNALLAQNGVPTTDGHDQLASFLEQLAARLDGAPATGNVVSTTA